MKFSLVMCTINRIDEPERFMRSLAAQQYKNFELIIVDQNTDRRLAPLVARYSDSFAITLLHSSPGLSRARNVALPYATGDVVAFPDDDCWYPPDLLEGVAMCFEGHAEWGGLSIRRADNEGSPMAARASVRLSRFNLWGRVPSISLFLRRCWVERVGAFDEALGVGAGTPWGAGEDTDYMLRALAEGCWCQHEPGLRVFHAPPRREADTFEAPRARAYARGLGRVLRKHRLPLWMVLVGCVLSVARAGRAIGCGRVLEARWHCEVLLGRISGWLARPSAHRGSRSEERPEDWK